MKQNLIALCCYLILLRRLEAVEVDQGPVEVVPGVALQKRTQRGVVAGLQLLANTVVQEISGINWRINFPGLLQLYHNLMANPPIYADPYERWANRPLTAPAYAPPSPEAASHGRP
ncbi:hypothetical protein JHK85_057074 [Glycine max]|nr:hypothetical protein JHK85_057074 [Glycine max]